MLAKDVMTAPVITVGPNADIRGIARLLVEWRISAVPVLDDNGRVVGIVSERDLMCRPESGTEHRRTWWRGAFADSEEQALDYVKTHGLQAKDVMTRKVHCVTEDTSLETIVTLLERHRIKRVPVTRDDKLVGIVARANLLQGLIASQDAEAASDAIDERTAAATLLQAIRGTGAGNFVNAVLRRGVVQLSGMVESEIEREAVRIAVQRMPGVARIADEIGVFPFRVRAAMWAD